MKRLISLVIAIVICVSLACPVWAAESGFVPSISYKTSPEIVPVQDDQGADAYGVLRDADGNVVAYLGHECLKITPVADALDEEKTVEEEIRNRLLFVYNGLNDGTVGVPYDGDLEKNNVAVRDLFDIVWICEEHKALFEQEGVTLDITFDLGIMEDVNICVMTYDETSGTWESIVKAVNNGDGTVTCTFSHFCVVAFSMITPVAAAATSTSGGSIAIWIVLFLLAAIAVAVILILKNRKKTAV